MLSRGKLLYVRIPFSGFGLEKPYCPFHAPSAAQYIEFRLRDSIKVGDDGQYRGIAHVHMPMYHTPGPE